jgi:hypothetical protein
LRNPEPQVLRSVSLSRFCRAGPVIDNERHDAAMHAI